MIALIKEFAIYLFYKVKNNEVILAEFTRLPSGHGQVLSCYHQSHQQESKDGYICCDIYSIVRLPSLRCHPE